MMFIIGIMIPIIGLSFVVVTNTLPSLRGYVRGEIESQVHLANEEIMEVVDETAILVESLANSQTEIDYDEQELRNMYSNILDMDNYEHIMNVYVGSEDGEMLIEPEQDLGEDYDPRERVWYEGAMQDGETFITEPYEDAGSGDYTVTVSYPLEDSVVGADINLGFLSEYIREISEEYVGSVYIVDRGGTIAAGTEGESNNDRIETLVDDYLEKSMGRKRQGH